MIILWSGYPAYQSTYLGLGFGQFWPSGSTPLPPPPQQLSISGAKGKFHKSHLNIRSEITRLKGIAQQIDGRRNQNEALIGPVSKEQLLGNALSKIQDSVNSINMRLAELEHHIILDAIFTTAGASAGYAVVTVGGQQFKVEIKALN